ncbi:MAG: radical SAM protein [Chloroflexi bacterium]|nr:radical SAM protein [Chloroflexota bacterium]
MGLEFDGVLYSPPAVQLRRGEVYLLIDPEAPNWVSVDATGARALRLCDGRRTFSEVLSSLGYGVDSQGLAAFLGRAAEVGFVANAPNLSPAYRGRGAAIGPQRLEELWIYTNNSCNLSCAHCLVSGGEWLPGQPTATEIRGWVEEALRLGAQRLYFTGGEPFLRQDIFDLIDYAMKRCELVILSNGTLLDEEAVARLAPYAGRPLLLQISLEAPEAVPHDALRGTGSFQKTVAALKRLLSAGLEPTVTTTLTALNASRVVDTSRFLAGLGIKNHHILWLHGRGRLRRNRERLAVSGERVQEIMAELREACAHLPITVDNFASLKVRARGKRGYKHDLCNACYSLLSIGPDGHVYPCASLTGAPQFDGGDVRARPLGEIWREASSFQWVRENSVQKRVGCSACFLKYICGGGCFCQAYYDYEMSTGEGCLMAPDPYCGVYKSQLVEMMWAEALPQEAPVTPGPHLYQAMASELPSCALSSTKTLDAAFQVGTYHCSCVLALEAKGI